MFHSVRTVVHQNGLRLTQVPEPEEPQAPMAGRHWDVTTAISSMASHTKKRRRPWFSVCNRQLRPRKTVRYSAAREALAVMMANV